MIGSSPADGSSKNRRSGSSIMRAGDAGALLHAARDLARQMLGEWTEPDEVELGLTEAPHGRAADRRPGGQRKREVLRQRQRAEERAGLEEHAEGRHALVQMRLANAVDVDPAGLRPLEADQVSQQRALAASRSAQNRQRRAALDLEAHVLHEHPRSPPDSQIVDDDVRP